MIAERLTSVQPITEDAGAVMRMIGTAEHKWHEGDYGHNFLRGYFVVNEKCEEVYLEDDAEEYNRLMDKYKEVQEQRLKEWRNNANKN